MTITLDEQQLAKARASAQALDLLTRSPYKISPSAPIIIPILMIVVTLFTLICLAFKLIMYYLRKSKNSKQNICSMSNETSGKISVSDVEQLASSSKGRPIRLDQLTPQRATQLKSVAMKASSGGKYDKRTGTVKAISRFARHHPNIRSSSSDADRAGDGDNQSIELADADDGNSPTDFSRDGSDETNDVRAAQSDFVYAPPLVQPYSHELSPYPQQERHVVRMTSIDDYPTLRPTTESDI